jgi:hypothetical protein
MKKLLLNYKPLIYAFALMLLCANSISSQTLFQETFGTVAATTYTGGTSVPVANYTAVTTSSNAISTSSVSTSTDMYLNFAAKALTTQSANTNSSTSVTLIAPNSLIQVGQVVTGSGVSSNTIVSAISGTTLTLSQATTTTLTPVTLSFFNLSNRCSLTAPFSSLTSGINTTLTSNTKLVTWSVNMRVSRTMSSSSATYLDGAYYLAAVLCASSSDLTAANTDGYALILQRSIDNTASLNPGAVRLVKFHNGIGSSASGSVVSNALLATPSLNGGVAPSATAPNNVSIKVVYNPDFDSWQLFYREDPTTAPIVFADPSSGTFSSAGAAVVDATYTSTAMTHFGYLAGLSAASSAANQMQMDNFKINLDPIPAFTPAPTVEKRQSFSSTINPTVANLVASGTNIKWYAAETGGSPLVATTALSYTNYYASQTVGVTESDRVISQVFVGSTDLRTLPLYEGFSNYNIGDKLIVINNDTFNGTGLGAWSVTTQTGGLSADDVTIATSPTWSNTVLPTATGNAISYVGTGIDPELKFTNTTSGSLYSSFVFNAVDAPTNIVAAIAPYDTNYSTPTGIYSFMAQSPLTTTPVTYSNDYASGVMFRKNIVSGKYNLGLSKSSNGTECLWSPTEYDFNTQHLIVISYENIGNADSLTQVANLWIDPATSTQPAITTLSQDIPLTPVSRDHIDRIKILQASSTSTPTMIIDEIRVANNWGQALGGAATMGITSVKNSGLKMYPNPVSNGKLYISSASNLEKEVVIFNTLGQQVLQAKTVTEAINVSNLNKGTYFVKITEAGITAAKKLIIQ